MSNLPVVNKTYTLAEIETLSLRDSAFLQITLPQPDSDEGYLDAYPIQTSHFLMEDLLKIPEWANSRWNYIRETYEWIPLFSLIEADDELVKGLVTIEKYKYGDTHQGYWIVPKAFPREQYE